MSYSTPRTPLLTTPRLPYSTTVAVAIAKGGLTIGIRAMTCRIFLPGTSSRVCTKANRKPSAVPQRPTRAPRTRVLRRTTRSTREVKNSA